MSVLSQRAYWHSMTLRCGCYYRPVLLLPDESGRTPGYEVECPTHGRQEIIRVTMRLFDGPGENLPGQTR